MSVVKRKMLDLGSGLDKIGTADIISDDPNRQLITPEEQAFEGVKTFNSPPRVSVPPMSIDDAVSKIGLQDNTRCITYSHIETLFVTPGDIANGYVRLSRDLAPNQGQSLEIINFPGAIALTLGRDFGAQEPDRLTFSGYNLGKPGMVLPGQSITVKYNVCQLPSAGGYDYPAVDFSRVWLMEPTIRRDTPDPDPTVAHISGLMYQRHGIILTEKHSGKTLHFRNARTFERKSLTLPALETSNGERYRLFTAGGKFHLCQLPLLRAYTETGNYDQRTRYLSPPYFLGQFRCFVYDDIGWREAFTAGIDPELSILDNTTWMGAYVPGLARYSQGYSPYPVADVVPWGIDKIGIVQSWWYLDKKQYLAQNMHGKGSLPIVTVRVYDTVDYEEESRLREVLPQLSTGYSANIKGYEGSTWNGFVVKGAGGGIAATSKATLNFYGLANIDKGYMNEYHVPPYDRMAHVYIEDLRGYRDGSMYMKRVSSQMRPGWDGNLERETSYLTIRQISGTDDFKPISVGERTMWELTEGAQPPTSVWLIDGTHYLIEHLETEYDYETGDLPIRRKLLVFHIPTQEVENVVHKPYLTDSINRLWEFKEPQEEGEENAEEGWGWETFLATLY